MTEVQVEPEVNVVDELVPKGQNVTYTFGLDDHLVFTQKPLSYFGKIELISVLGGVLDKALAEGGMSVADLLEDVPQETGQLSEADQFIKSIARIVSFAPDFLKDLYVIALNVPRGDREYVKSVMELSQEEGGLSDEQGIQILETFVDQNWEVLLDFFKNRILPLVSRMTSPKEDLPSASSKPLKATRQRTPKV